MTQAQQRDYFEKLMRNVNETRGFVKYSGVKITRLERGRCEGELAVTPDSCNYLGIVHGGCLTTLADTVAGVAARSTGGKTVTLSCNMNFLRPAAGPVIRCVAEPEKLGRQVSVFHCTLTNDAGQPVASGQFTFFITGPLDIDDLALG